MDDMIARFQGIGLTASKAKETAVNAKLSSRLSKILDAAGASSIDKAKGTLLYTLASTMTPETERAIPLLTSKILSDDLATSKQVTAALTYVSKLPEDAEIKVDELDKASGVGVTVTEDDIKQAVKSLLEEEAATLSEKKHGAIGHILKKVRDVDALTWANAALVKAELDAQLLALLGPKPQVDKKAAKKAAKADAPRPATPEAAAKTTTVDLKKFTEPSFQFCFEGYLGRLHKPGENPQKYPHLIEAHNKATGKRVMTRFPPEPNGFLHIGHAKAININFGYAQAHNGECKLRYDDTNPEAEEEQYFTSILDSVRWLGFEPSQITYSSDYFQELYDCAEFLINKDLAYVCHCTGEEIHAQRGGEEKGPRYSCEHSKRPKDENLTEFRRMRDGHYKEGEATLRMRMDMQSPNPQFWDLVAYRVLDTPHFRTGSQWRIYPTYDFTHCLVDSFENITHSLCTTEFRMSRESYIWLVDAAEVYRPPQWEYGRLNLTHAILSKRKLNKLVDEGLVSGWDDPRLYTIVGIRRRGFTPEAINAFVRDLGVTPVNSTIDVGRLENYVREHLNAVAPRLFAALEPLKVTLTNLPESHREMVTLSSKNLATGEVTTRDVPFTRTLYIDASDFKETPEPGFLRLTKGGAIRLLELPEPVICKDVVKNDKGEIVELVCEYGGALPQGVNAKKLKFIQWIAEDKETNSPVKVEARLYEHLFIHPNPNDKEAVPGGWLTDINPNSLSVRQAFVDVGVRGAKVEDKFQFTRLGYFCVDRDSKPEEDKYVFNRTVTLNQDNAKKD